MSVSYTHLDVYKRQELRCLDLTVVSLFESSICNITNVINKKQLGLYNRIKL